MRWALVTHPEHIKTLPNGRFVLMVPPMVIAEHCIAAAVEQQWIVLATDSAFLPAADDVRINVQMNPRRIIQPGEDA